VYYVKLSWRLKLINSSRADSRVISLKSNVSGTETVPETLDFNEMTRLSAGEEFIKFLQWFSTVTLQYE
jgi:hypothetical protein